MTDEQKNTPSGTEQREENVDLYALFFKYFAYWPWFVASAVSYTHLDVYKRQDL